MQKSLKGEIPSIQRALHRINVYLSLVVRLVFVNKRCLARLYTKLDQRRLYFCCSDVVYFPSRRRLSFQIYVCITVHHVGVFTLHASFKLSSLVSVDFNHCPAEKWTIGLNLNSTSGMVWRVGPFTIGVLQQVTSLSNRVWKPRKGKYIKFNT